jgi:alpha-N-arabinofuranosidase
MEGCSNLQLGQALQLHDSDLKAVNSKAEPDRVRPSRMAELRAEGSTLHATLLPASWNVIRATISG